MKMVEMVVVEEVRGHRLWRPFRRSRAVASQKVWLGQTHRCHYRQRKEEGAEPMVVNFVRQDLRCPREVALALD